MRLRRRRREREMVDPEGVSREEVEFADDDAVRAARRVLFDLRDRAEAEEGPQEVTFADPGGYRIRLRLPARRRRIVPVVVDDGARPMKVIPIEGGLLGRLVAEGVLQREPSAEAFFAAIGGDPEADRQFHDRRLAEREIVWTENEAQRLDEARYAALSALTGVRKPPEPTWDEDPEERLAQQFRALTAVHRE